MNMLWNIGLKLLNYMNVMLVKYGNIVTYFSEFYLNTKFNVGYDSYFSFKSPTYIRIKDKIKRGNQLL